MTLTSITDGASVSTWATYHRATRSGTYGFLMALPLLVLYEGLIMLGNHGQVMQVRVGAEVWIKQLLAALGAVGGHMLAVVVLVVGVGILIYERKKQIPLRPRYFGWMVAESTLYAIVVAFAVSVAVGVMFAIAPIMEGSVQSARPVTEAGLWTKLALSIGAGLYEELVFRVVLVGGLYVVLKRAFSRRDLAYPVAAVVGALLFSAVHYVGALGDAFTMASFTFRFLFGLVLNGLFLWRGFGIAAWTHALYDVMIVTGVLG